LLKNHLKWPISRKPDVEIGGNMRNRLFVPDFLFDFYTNRWSIGTPSALSNESRTWLWKFHAKPTKCRLCVCSHFDHKQSKNQRTIFSNLVEGWALYWYASKHLFWSIDFADRWRWKCAVRTSARKHVQGGKFEHLSHPHRKS